jgi:hypothetical protein
MVARVHRDNVVVTELGERLRLVAVIGCDLEHDRPVCQGFLACQINAAERATAELAHKSEAEKIISDLGKRQNLTWGQASEALGSGIAGSRRSGASSPTPRVPHVAAAVALRTDPASSSSNLRGAPARGSDRAESNRVEIEADPITAEVLVGSGILAKLATETELLKGDLTESIAIAV